MTALVNFCKHFFFGNPETENEKKLSQVFINWINNFMQEEQMQIKISNINDLIDESYMKILVEMIWEEKINDEQLYCNSNEFKVQQFQSIIQFLKSKGCCIPDINVDQLIKKKDLKNLLELVWIVICNQSIDQIYYHGIKGKDGLLQWCNNFTETNFSSFLQSWDDGKTILHILHHFYPKEIDKGFFTNNCEPLNIFNYAISNLQKIGIPVMIDDNCLINLDEKPVIIQYSVMYNFLSSAFELHSNLNQNDNNHEDKNYYTACYSYSLFDQPNFNCGLIPDEKLLDYVKKENFVIKKINEHFKLMMHSRYPVQVAFINKDLKVIYKHPEFEKVIKRSGPRPIIFISILGKYQQGKSTLSSAITGNIGYKIGNGRGEETKGVYIDGPYDIDYLYQRFNIKIRDDIYYKGKDLLSPLIYFFDFEGYEGIMHGDDIEKNNKAYIEMCTPFLCLSSIFLLLSDQNPELHEITSFFERVKVSSLTTYSNKNDSNGALQLNIVINKYNEISHNFNNLTKKDIKNAIKKFQKDFKKEWIGNEKLINYGINFDFSPILEGLNPFFQDGSFYQIFRYFVKNIVRSIEKAAEGKFVRTGEKSIEIFKIIIDHLDDPQFEEKIKMLIKTEHENSFETFSVRAFTEAKCRIFPDIEDEFQNYQNNLNFNLCIDDIKNKYIMRGKKEILNELSTIQDHPSVFLYIEKLESSIIEKIDEKCKHLYQYKNELAEQSNNKIVQKIDQISSNYLKDFLKDFSAYNYNNLNQKAIGSYIDRKMQLFKTDIYNYKRSEKLSLLNNQKIDIMIDEKRHYFINVCNNYIRNDKRIAIELHEEEELLSKLNSLNKKSIENEYISCEKQILLDLHLKLEKKEFYKQNYENISKIGSQFQHQIYHHIYSKKEEMIRHNCSILTENNEKYSKIIKRLLSKNELNIDDNIILLDIKSNQKDFFAKLKVSFDHARIKLAKKWNEIKKKKISLMKVSVETRKIVEYPDGKVDMGKWKIIRIENSQFADILEDIGDGISECVEIAYEFVSDHYEEIKSGFSKIFDLIKLVA